MTGSGKLASLPARRQPQLPYIVHLARLSSSLFAAALFATPAMAVAQSVAGPLDNAAVLPGGVFRLTLAPRWEAATLRFGSPIDGGSATEDVGGFLSSDSLGVSHAPSLAEFEQRVRDVSGDGAFRMSLGVARVRAQSRATVVPLTLEYGIGRRIAVGVTIPLVRSVVNLAVSGNTRDSVANAGLSPASYNPGEANRLTTLATQFTTALSQLRSRNPTCFGGSPGAGCAPVLALDNAARAYAALIAGTYGTTAIVPAAGTAPHDSVLARLISFNDQFRAALGQPATANPISIRPLGALPIAIADLHTLVTDSTFGIRADSLLPLDRMTLGDVEASITIGLVDRWAATAGPRIRASATALFRAGTGRPGRPNVLLDATTGDGQHDIEGRLAVDAFVSRRFIVGMNGRYVVQLADELDMRIPLRGVRLLPAARRQLTRRDLGDELALDIRGHFALSTYLGGTAAYGFARRGADAYPAVPDGDGFISPSRSVQTLAVGMTYSTLDAFARGKSRLPLEVGYQHRQAFAGSGGAPLTFSEVVALRVYAGGGRKHVR